MKNKLKMLAIDLGASSGRGIIGEFDGERITLRENHRFPNEPVLLNGSLRWDILRIFHEIKKALGKCATGEDRDIRSIGIDTWGVDYGLIDKAGQLMENPFHYRDGRTAQMIEKAFTLLPKEEIYRITGTQFMDFNTVFQLLSHLSAADPWQMERADKLLFTPDLLNYFLTGQARCEYTIASTSQLLDARTRDWSRELIRAMGIPGRLFSPIVRPGTVLGPLLPALTEEIGALEARVISIASHDTASAVVSVPATSEDFVYISSGTWSLMGCELQEPRIDPRTAEYQFTNEGGYGGTIRLLKNIMGLWLEQESKRQWEREGETVTFDGLSSMAMASPEHQCFIDPDYPAFSPPGDLPRRIAEYCRKTGQYVPQTKGEIVRCIFDSLAMKYRNVMEKIEELRGAPVSLINIVGGGTKEAPLCQLAANACGKPVHAGPVEATACGNIAVQAMALGEISSLAQARELIRASFPIVSYQPADTEKWDAAYRRYLAVTEN